MTVDHCQFVAYSEILILDPPRQPMAILRPTKRASVTDEEERRRVEGKQPAVDYLAQCLNKK
jgi:hypothetical protein